MTVLLVLIITTLFGRLASLFFPKNSFDYDELQQKFSANSNNFQSIMAALSNLSYQVLGARTETMFVKLWLMLLLAFLVALAWYTLHITGLRVYLDFWLRGLTLQIGDEERNWLLQNWPWVYLDYSRNLGTEISVANQYLEAVALTSAIFIVLSASLSISILNGVALVRKFGHERFQVWQALLKILFSMFRGLAIDFLFILAFLVLTVVAGRAFNISVEEVYEASVADKWLEYGYTLSVGNYHIGEALIGVELRVAGVDFDSLPTNQSSGPEWVHWIFPNPSFVEDAGAICRRNALSAVECADHLRALYFEKLPQLGYSATLFVQIVKDIGSLGTSLACGNNLWSSIPKFKMQEQLITIFLPLFAALAVVALSRFFVMPWLALIVLLDYAMVRLGRYVARSSEKGLSLVSRLGPGLLAAPPVIAIGLLTLLAKAVC